jgi:hypothetical protein
MRWLSKFDDIGFEPPVVQFYRFARRELAHPGTIVE